MEQSEQLNPDAPVKEYTGVWIPAEVMESEELSAIEKILYGEIAGFRICYASNKWLANRIGRAERTVKRLVNHLIECGYVENLGFNGRFRTIRVVSRAKNGTSAMPKMTPIIIKNNNSNKLLLDSRPVENSKKEYGNKDVNELLNYWKEQVGIVPSNNKANRNACATLIRQRGLENAKKTVLCIGKAMRSQDKYAPHISSFSELYGAYGKLPKLDAWIIKNSPKTALKRYQASNTEDYEPSDAERAETLKRMKEARKKLFK